MGRARGRKLCIPENENSVSGVTSHYATPIPSEVLQHADVTTDAGTHPLEPLAQDQNGRYGKTQDIWIDTNVDLIIHISST